MNWLSCLSHLSVGTFVVLLMVGNRNHECGVDFGGLQEARANPHDSLSVVSSYTHSDVCSYFL